MIHYKYDLRCVFEYTNKPAWRSMWNTTGVNSCDKACFQSQQGLLYAVIEGKDVETRTTIRLAEIPAQDFCCFQWVAVVGLPMQMRGSISLRGRNIGLKILSREQEITVFRDGKIEIKQKDPNTDRLLHYGRANI